MTYTKRQWLIYRTNQSVNLLSKTLTYLNDVSINVEGTRYEKEINQLYRKVHKAFVRLNKFNKIVKSMELTKS